MGGGKQGGFNPSHGGTSRKEGQDASLENKEKGEKSVEDLENRENKKKKKPERGKGTSSLRGGGPMKGKNLKIKRNQSITGGPM